jgi:hypothetical protein
MSAAAAVEASLWHPDADAWDAPFRAWAEAVTTQTAAFGGMVAMLVAEWIGAAWRLRRANTDVAVDRSLTNRQWATVEREARRSLWRAGVDLKRWTRLLTEELQRRAKRGDAAAEGQMATLLSLPTPPPFPPARWISPNDDPAPESDASPVAAMEIERTDGPGELSTSSYNLSATRPVGDALAGMAGEGPMTTETGPVTGRGTDLRPPPRPAGAGRRTWESSSDGAGRSSRAESLCAGALTAAPGHPGHGP